MRHRLTLLMGLAIAPAIGAAALPEPTSASAPADDAALKPLVDRLASEAVQSRMIPHLIVAVSSHGRRRYFSYGSEGPPFASDTIVEIGSLTKTFTAALFAEALDERVMAADDTLARRVPSGIALSSCTSAITLQDLATFRSGMPLLPSDVPRRIVNRSIDHYSVADFYGWLSTWSPAAPDNSPDGRPLRARCGLPAAYEYSNASYGLLGLAIASAYATPWEQLVAARITAPLGMVDTSVAPGRSQLARLAPGHGREGQPVVPWPYFAWFAAGALRSTPADMLNYGEAALGHGVAGGRQVPAALTRAFAGSMRARYQPERKPFTEGFSWGLLPRDPGAPEGPRLAFKDGGTDGFNSVIVVDSQADLAIFVVADMAKSGVPALGISIARQIASESGAGAAAGGPSDESLTSEP